MAETISAALSQLVNFNEEELSYFMKLLKVKKLKQHAFLLQAGEVCKMMVIINYGGLRYFKIGEKGEQSHWFAFEGDWLGDYESFLTRSPSPYYIQALEDTEIYCLYYDDMQHLYEKGVNFERFGRLMAERLFVAVGRARMDLVSLSAEQRYLKLMADFPNISKRIQVQHIATYLGIHPQSLSRIRKNIARAKD